MLYYTKNCMPTHTRPGYAKITLFWHMQLKWGPTNLFKLKTRSPAKFSLLITLCNMCMKKNKMYVCNGIFCYFNIYMKGQLQQISVHQYTVYSISKLILFPNQEQNFLLKTLYRLHRNKVPQHDCQLTSRGTISPGNSAK